MTYQSLNGFDLPAGVYDVKLEFTDSRLRTAGTVISITTIVALLAMAAAVEQRRGADVLIISDPLEMRGSRRTLVTRTQSSRVWCLLTCGGRIHAQETRVNGGIGECAE